MSEIRQPALSKLTSYQILVIVILALTQFTVCARLYGDVTLGRYTNEINGSDSYAFNAGVSGIATAEFSDRFDRKKLFYFFI